MEIETKGYLSPKDRQALLAAKKAYPKLDLRLVFQRASNKIGKGPNSMTYWRWAERHGFPWAEGEIPKAWLKKGRRHG